MQAFDRVPAKQSRTSLLVLSQMQCSTVWIGIKSEGNDSKTLEEFDGRIAIPAGVEAERVTVFVPKDLIDEVGQYAATIDEPSGRRTAVGMFKLLPFSSVPNSDLSGGLLGRPTLPS